MNPTQRQHFDRLLEDVIEHLPDHLRRLLEESPVIADDFPSAQVLRELELDENEYGDICGLYSGTPLTDRSVSHAADLPETIHLFREPIVRAAGGWRAGETALGEEIRITLFHEIGHHFGLDEDELDNLGYG